MAQYDIAGIYEEMEKHLLDSMARNLMRHTKEEAAYGFEWEQWQAAKLREMRKFRKHNQKIIGQHTKNLPKHIKQHLENEFKQGLVGEAKKHKAKFNDKTIDLSDGFFGTNDKKVQALIDSVNNDLNKANHAALRRTNDIYRQTVHKAAMFSANGVMTPQQAIGKAIQEFKAAGINCIVYSNGAHHRISNYARMAIRTAETRAMLMGEGKFRQEYGETLVQITKHGTACPLCQPFESKVFIDDVYSGGTWENSKDKYERVPVAIRGKVRLLSEAMAEGLYHPNCRHGIGTFYVDLLDDAKPVKATPPAQPEKTAEQIAAEWAAVRANVAQPVSKTVVVKTKEDAERIAKDNGVKYVDYSKIPIETAIEFNKAIETLPDDIRPIFIGDSVTLENYWGGKLPRSSKQYYGVTINTFDGIHLGYGKGIDFNTTGQMVGISASYKNLDKITVAKQAAQERYQQKFGRKWFFNVTGKTTPYHEMGHVYANIKGLPDGFEADALKWAKESSCDMLLKPTEAWAEAWAAYYTKTADLPEYISKYIEKATAQKTNANTLMGLLSFDDDGIILQKQLAFKSAFERGEISTLISAQKQARHVRGSKQYNEYVAVFKSKGSDNMPAYIREDLDITDLQRLVVDKMRGNVRVNADGSFTEFVVCDDVIGYYYSPKKGEYIETHCAMVKYSLGSRNIHIVPVKKERSGLK